MIVYKITNRINGKIYIGQTVKSLKLRWAQHCSPSSGCTALHNAIKKHGPESFTVEQIDVAASREELDEKERYWISFYDCIAPKGYNLCEGGDGCRGYKHSDKTRKFLSVLRKGKKGSPHTEEWKREASERQKGKKHPHKGKPMSEEQKRRLSESKKGKENPNKWKRVLCVETGEVFPSRKAASEFVGFTPGAITNAIKRGNKCGGYTFEYAQ